MHGPLHDTGNCSGAGSSSYLLTSSLSISAARNEGAILSERTSRPPPGCSRVLRGCRSDPVHPKNTW